MVLTCTGVSFYHGSNDGRKGIGPHPSAGYRGPRHCTDRYTLDRAVTTQDVQDFISRPRKKPAAFLSLTWSQVQFPASYFQSPQTSSTAPRSFDARAVVTEYIRTKQLRPNTVVTLGRGSSTEPRSCFYKNCE